MARSATPPGPRPTRRPPASRAPGSASRAPRSSSSRSSRRSRCSATDASQSGPAGLPTASPSPSPSVAVAIPAPPTPEPTSRPSATPTPTPTPTGSPEVAGLRRCDLTARITSLGRRGGQSDRQRRAHQPRLGTLHDARPSRDPASSTAAARSSSQGSPASGRATHHDPGRRLGHDARRRRRTTAARPRSHRSASPSTSTGSRRSSRRPRRTPTRPSRRATVRASRRDRDAAVVGELSRTTRSVAVSALVAVVLVAGCMPAALAAGPRASSPTGHGTAVATQPATAAALAATPRPTPIARASAAPNLSQLVGQRLIVAMDGTTMPEPRPARPDPARRDRRRHPVRPERHDGDRAARPHEAAPRRRDGRRPAAAPDRRRPGRRLDQADPVGAADALAAADGRRRPDEHRPFAGRGHRHRARGPRHQHRPRPGRRRPASHSYSILNKQGRTFSFNASVVSALTNAFAEGLGVRGRPPDDEALPGTRLRHDEHRYDRRHDHRVEGCPRPGPRAVPGGRREPPPPRDAVERDVPGLRRRERGRLVAGDRDGPAARRPGLHGRDDDRLARRHRPRPRACRRRRSRSRPRGPART